MHEETEAQRYNDYVAVVQRGILGILAARSGADITLPEYIEFMYPDRQESAAEVKARIIRQLTK